MKQVSKTDFGAMTSPELTSTGEVLKIVSNKMTIGYFVPIELWGQQHVTQKRVEEKK